MPNIAKVFTGIVGAGAIGGLSYGTIMLSNMNTVKDKLISEGFELATTEDFKELIKEHNKKEDSKINIFQDENTEDKEKNEKWLEGKCKEALNKKNKENYRLASQWCVKQEKISAILGKTGKQFKFLDNTSTTNDKDHWPKKIANLTGNPNTIKALGFTEGTEKTLNVDSLKEKCKAIGEIQTIAKDFSEKFELAKQWCSVKS